MVIGAGQAGLSAAYFLRRWGFAPGTGFVVLDADTGPGGGWQHRWSSLRLGDVHGIYGLPGMAFDDRAASRPAAKVVPEYFAEYELRFALPVRRPEPVAAVRYGRDGRLLVESDGNAWSVRRVINATGTWTKPFVPYYPGIAGFTGRQLHTADYTTAEEFRGERVVLVGGGLSAIELLTEISAVAETTWVTRREPEFTGTEFTAERGRRVVAAVERRVRNGLLPGSVVSGTGIPDTAAVRRARAAGVLDTRYPMFDRITPNGVAWSDGTFATADAIVWCTGFRPAVDHLTPLRLRTPDGGIRLDGTRAAEEPRLHLVGYGPSASTIGANRAGRRAAKAVRDELAAPAVAA